MLCIFLTNVRTSSEERVPSKNDTLVSVLEEEANAVLRVARRMKRLCGDALANLEHLTVGRCLGDRLAVFASYHLQFAELFELYQSDRQVCIACERARGSTYNLIVTTGMIPVAVTDVIQSINQLQHNHETSDILMGVDDRTQLDLPGVNLGFQHRRNPGQRQLASFLKIREGRQHTLAD